MVAMTHSYRYLRPSAVDTPGRRVGLATSGGTTSRGPLPHPRFFSGTLTRPEAAARGLLSVAAVARTRYFRPSLDALRDPVVTCDGQRLRFESFSACCGVHARLDVLPGGLDGEVLDRGTTNVDVNDPLREALARVRGEDPLRLSVGADQLTVTTADGAVVEKKVPLPERWLRGFAELQVISAPFDLRAELPAAEAVRLLRSLPAGTEVLWMVPAGRTLRRSARPVPGAVALAGARRLEVLAPLLRFARALRVYGPTVGAGSLPVASAWELELPGMRLVLTLSPEVTRGFSGEGAVLDALAADEVEADAELIGALVDFEPAVDTGELARLSGLPLPRVKAALGQLGTAGRVGYDVAEAAYFHRELPYDAAGAERLNPRLRGARALLADDVVRLAEGGDTATIAVPDHVHRVRLSPQGAALGCTCPWWSRYRGTRGKCKHALAAELRARRGRGGGND
ncbi:zinc finger SWIM domain protein [Streptomyces xiamenensis]|uniref:Zinc finger SWIM domain protein n=1 Tax=Streptomyces xiamenensis TaxID=408015 RepID=A0A0F7FYK1_9ACTN|nr:MULTISPECIES: SWIM zinc finger family protein [Streptomyces]AKG45820.1 zinc finger SWIM domain protein [Streptomyces xiamenensis]